MLKSRVVITGANGQLGKEFSKQLSEIATIDAISLDSRRLDISLAPEVETLIASLKPDLVINCAAYTAVDKAETEIELSNAVNRDGARYLAEACESHHTKLLHFSTDYVFDGRNNTPYLSTDKCNPINHYGASKRNGEIEIQNVGGQTKTIRLSWLYSEFGKNFPLTIRQFLQEKEEIHVVNDQVSSPTWTRPLVKFLVHEMLLETDFYNNTVEHWTEEGEASWFDIATQINKNFNKKVTAVDSDFFQMAAKRPSYSKLENSLTSTGSKTLSWQENLTEFLSELK